MERYQQSITKWKKFTTRFETIPKNNSKTQEPIQSPNDSLIISLYKIIQLNIELYPTEYLIEKLETLKDILFNPINIRLIERQEIDIQNIHDWLIQLRLSKFNDPILNVEFLGLILKSGLQMNLLQMIEIAREKTFFSTNITHHNTISVIWIHDSNLNWKEEEIFTKNPKNIQNTNFIEIESDHNQKEVLDLVEDSYIKSHGKIRVVISTNAPFDSVVILNDLRKEKSYYFPILIYFPEKFFHENLLEISICEVLIKKNKFSHVWTTENPRIIQYFCCLNMMKIESNVYNQMSTHLNSLIIEARDTKGIISGQIIKKIMLISKLDFSRLCVGGEVPPQRFENFVAEKKPTENLHVLDSDFDIPFTGASFVFTSIIQYLEMLRNHISNQNQINNLLASHLLLKIVLLSMNYSTNVSFDFFSEFSDVSKLLTPTQFIGRMVYLIEPFRGISIKSYKNIRVVKLNQVVESIQSEIFHTYQVSYTKQRSDNLLEKYKCFEDNISNIFVSGLCSVVIGSFQNILNLVPILRDDFSSHIILIADNSNVSMKMKNDLISKYTNLFVVEKKEIRNFLKKYLN